MTSRHAANQLRPTPPRHTDRETARTRRGTSRSTTGASSAVGRWSSERFQEGCSTVTEAHTCSRMLWERFISGAKGRRWPGH
jgi:hypothetical protein